MPRRTAAMAVLCAVPYERALKPHLRIRAGAFIAHRVHGAYCAFNAAIDRHRDRDYHHHSLQVTP